MSFGAPPRPLVRHGALVVAVITLAVDLGLVVALVVGLGLVVVLVVGLDGGFVVGLGLVVGLVVGLGLAVAFVTPPSACGMQELQRRAKKKKSNMTHNQP